MEKVSCMLLKPQNLRTNALLVNIPKNTGIGGFSEGNRGEEGWRL